MNYHRYFITLTPDSKGYEYGGKKPLGRCILEDRGKSGKLSLWVQDLKAEAPYKIVLILSDMGKYLGAPLGSLYVDGKGKGEFKNEFETINLADGQGLSRMCAVAVMAGGSGELLCPLVGYKDNTVLWKNHFTMQDAGKESIPKNTQPAGIKLQQDIAGVEIISSGDAQSLPAHETEDTPAEVSADEAPITGDNEITDMTDAAVPGMNGQDAPEKTEIEQYADEPAYMSEYEQTEPKYIRFTDEPDADDPSADGDDSQFPEEDTVQDPVDYNLLSNLQEIFDTNIEITPFEPKSANEKWVRISLREPVYMPIDYRTLMNHPLIISSYKKYNHLIMGYINDSGKTRYILGVPGVYEPQYVNAAHQMGFTQFKTVTENEELRPFDYGYWLAQMYIAG